MAAGPSVIPRTKLHIPGVRAGIVPRDGLVELLVRGQEIAIDAFHHAVYALATGVAYELIDGRD